MGNCPAAIFFWYLLLIFVQSCKTRMKTEKEKMLAGEPYDAHGEEMIGIRTDRKSVV